MSKKTPKKVSLKDKDVSARQARKVTGGSFSFGEVQCATGATEKRTYKPFVITKEIDKASP